MTEREELGRLDAVRALLADSFRFSSPDAPGLHFMGGLADPVRAGLSGGLPKISVAGSGLTGEGAEVRCLGEAAERLSSLYDVSRAAELIPAAEIPDDLLALAGEDRTAIPCLQGQRLTGGEAVWVPAGLVLADPAGALGAPVGKTARGIAAGPDWQSAVDSALAELVERDAAALWWLGGKRACPVSLDALAGTDAPSVLQSLRQGQTGRMSWLLDLSGEFGLAAVAGVSVMENGEGFACGLSANADAGRAFRSALVEMAQMELSQHLIRGKAKALGPEGLTEPDFKQIERSVRITPDACPLILPEGPPRHAPVIGQTVAMVSAVSELYVVDCTLPSLGIPVAAVLAPALQPMDASVMTDRLQAVVRKTGGGEQFHQGLQLI